MEDFLLQEGQGIVLVWREPMIDDPGMVGLARFCYFIIERIWHSWNVN